VAVSLGEAHVEIIPETKGFGKKVEDDVEKQTRGIGDKAGKEVGENFSKGFGGAMKAIGAAAAGAAVVGFAKSAIGAATDLNEQMSKTKVVFGDAADSVIDFGKNARTSIGASQVEALTAAGTFGNLLRSVGVTGEKAADMSTSMVQLAGDLASFNNVPVAEALDAIRSGLVGETEPLKKFAVNLNEATIKQEAMRLGLDTSGTTLDANVKAQAAYSIIMKQTSLAQGDFARTSDSLANQQRILSAQFADAKAEIGQALLPAMLAVVGAGQDMIPAFTGIATAIGNVVTMAAPLIDIFGKVLGSDVGSGFLTIAVGATAAFLAMKKIMDIGGKVTEAIKGLGTAMTTTNVALAGIGLVVGVAAMAWTSYSSSQAAARKAQEDFNDAVLKAGDPTAQLANNYAKLAEAGVAVAESTNRVLTGIDAVIAKELDKNLAGNSAAMERLGLSFDDVFAIVKAGGPAYDDLINSLRNHGTTATKTSGDNIKFTNSLEDTRSAIDANRDAMAADIDKGLEFLLRHGEITRQQLDEAKARSGSTDETERSIAAGEAFNSILQAQSEANGRNLPGLTAAADATSDLASAQDEASGSSDALLQARQRLTDAAKKDGDAAADAAVKYGLSVEAGARVVQAEKDGKEATDANTKAKKDLADALDEARQAQEDYLFATGGAQVQVDNVTSSTRDLVKATIEGAEAAGRGEDAFAGNTDQAIKNRDALQNVYERATSVINGYDDLGYSSDVAKQKQGELAQSMYDTAIQAGATEEEAAKLRDGILKIPEERNTKVKVAEEGTAETSAKIDSAAETRNAIIRVSLSAVGVSDEMLRTVMNTQLTYTAKGALVSPRRGGSLLVAGEAGQAEAVVPLTRAFQRGLAAITAQGAVASGGGTTVTARGGAPVINVNVTGQGMGNAAEARHLGRIVGESAAQVLAHRQLATSVRVG
jgi:hypothetical protein